ncbi:hypothetical protein [uncultured Microbacterium sp.]|uniref:hypothetical protein n=1 Tax=uncultured Microbacterium sp. TaxID=191216 RepID=UPI00258AAE1F|nr:hypothetical protein [uncultured Microbacterium sp.]
MATYARTVRRGLPRTPGGEPWPPAGEAPIDGIDNAALVSGLRDHGHRGPAILHSRAALASEILERTTAGDLVMCLGAGDITGWAADLPAEMEALRGGAS